MDELVRLKSGLVSTVLAGAGAESQQQMGEGAAAKLVDGILRRKSFYFQQRSGKLDMRAIGRVDVDSVVKEVDIDTLQAHLENVVFADVSEDDLRLYSDACFLNLFRLSQLLLEYLLSVQDTLATSLEALASKHASLRQMLDRGRAELHRTSEQARALKREVRQKRATIMRYEQLLALSPPPGSGLRSGDHGDGGQLHNCLTCGKMFTTDEFLQQHIIRKHARGDDNNRAFDIDKRAESKPQTDERDKCQAVPPQLRLFVQTSSGQCLDMMVQSEATVAQLRGYINSTAGFAAAGASKRLVYRGIHLHDDQTLSECHIPTDSQLVLIDNQVLDASHAQAKAEPAEPPPSQKGVNEESAASKQMSTLVDLMRQQMEWTMRSQERKRDQEMGAAEAIEIRMRKMEASLPRRLEEFMEESVGGLKSSLRKALDDMETSHAKRSNAGALVDDEEETRRKEDEEKKQLKLLHREMQRVSKENAALLDELQKMKTATTSMASTNVAGKDVPKWQTTSAVTVVQQSPPPQTEVAPTSEVYAQDIAERTPPKSSLWDLAFPSDGQRAAVTIRVARTDTCASVCESIAAALDIAEARVLLKDIRGGDTLDPGTSSEELRSAYEADSLRLEVLEGTIVSDTVVDGLVEFYERNVPTKARESRTVNNSMAELEFSAKRHVIGSIRNGGLPGDGMDATEHAETQVEAIRAELSATLTGARGVDLSKSISRTAPLGLGMGFVADTSVNDISHESIFGADAGDARSRRGLGLEQLQGAVEQRHRSRPEGIERQMERVSHSVENQLSQMLEQAEQELEQLERDSLGGDTYSSTDGDDITSRGPNGYEDQRLPPVNRDVNTSDMESADRNRYEIASARKSRGSSVGSVTSLGTGDEVLMGAKSDWNKTLDTAVSIPVDAEARADEHEANAASLEGI